MQRFALQDQLASAKLLYRRAQTMLPSGTPEIWHAAVIVNLLLKRAGVSEEVRYMIMETMAVAKGHPWEGALALCDGRYATVAPSHGKAVHLDLQSLSEIGDPYVAGYRPVMSTIFHLGTILTGCKGAHVDSNVPPVSKQN